MSEQASEQPTGDGVAETAAEEQANETLADDAGDGGEAAE